MAAAKVWVTRSEPGASRLADALKDLRVSVGKCPAIEILSLVPHAEGPEPDVCIVVSQHAAAGYVQSSLLQTRAVHIAVGRASRDALGLDAIVPREATTEGILELAALKGSGKVIWILAGVGGREDLQASLSAQGHIVRKLEFYERRVTSMTDFTPSPGDIVEVSSLTALDAVVNAVESAESDELQQSLTLLVPSERIAEAAEDRKFYNARIACSAEMTDVVSAAAEMLKAR